MQSFVVQVGSKAFIQFVKKNRGHLKESESRYLYAVKKEEWFKHKSKQTIEYFTMVRPNKSYDIFRALNNHQLSMLTIRGKIA